MTLKMVSEGAVRGMFTSLIQYTHDLLKDSAGIAKLELITMRPEEFANELMKQYLMSLDYDVVKPE